MSLYAVGDVHGSFYTAKNAINPLCPSLTSSDVLVMVGDVGIAYGDHFNGQLRRYLASLPCLVLVMRGNHDVRYWRDMKLDKLSQVRSELVEWSGSTFMRDSRYPNTLYVNDAGDLVTIDGHCCLFVPGAWSIDGAWRRKTHEVWEPEEQLSEHEMARLLELASTNPVEHVFSHTCPKGWIGDLSDLLFPPESAPPIDDTMEIWMDEVLKACDATLSGWWFGHYHGDRTVANGLGHLLYRAARKVF